MAVINTNVKAIVAQDSMRVSNLKLATAMERLSTGLRINSAKDDAAGLAISERMNAQVRGFGMAIKNANDGLSMAQTADGAYGEVTSMLQRMRELSVQAANGTMSSLDRRSIQLEIDELKTEIENVATKTHFNNITLLDGTAKSVNLQIGANLGDTMEIGFDSVRTKDIGSGLKPALTSVGGLVEKFDAFSAGDLIVNGTMIGASLRADDSLSYSVLDATDVAAATAEIAASAIAKVAAINRVSEQSGVYARVNDTTVQGSTMPAPTTSVGPEAITINGVSTNEIALGLDNEENRQLVVQAINNISGQTGVRATNTGDDQNGILLVAEDGRNITIAFEDGGDFTSENTGLGTAGVHVGTYSLYSELGETISIEHQVGGDITGTGLKMGTFDPDRAIVVTTERSGDPTDTTGGPQIPLAAGIEPDVDNVGILSGDTVVINDITIGAARATYDTASFTTTASAKAASAIAVAAAINEKAELTGVTAIAGPNVIRSEVEASFTAGESGTLSLNGVDFGISSSSRNGVIEAINAYTGQTGVMARVYGQGIELVAEDGRNIVIATDLDPENLGLAGVTLGSGTDAETDGVVFYASVTLASDDAFTVRRGSEGGDNFSLLGFREGTFGGNDTGVKIAEIDVTTQEGASIAIDAIDSAIEDVAAAQARSGAFQNRLDAVVSVLSESVENITASRSRILDTDYALEATNLAKAQIISQAANAMLAQANQSQQTVLQLLQ